MFGLVFFPVCSYVVIVNLKRTLVCVIGGVMALATSLRAVTSAVAPNATAAATAIPSSTLDGNNSNPYAVIMDRNVFRLNPPPAPVVTNQKPVDLPKVYLNGIIKIGDEVRVLFSIPAKDTKSQTTYFKLAPGEKDGVLELVNIHPDQQEVDVLVNDTAMTLSMLSNSLAATDSKAGGAHPGSPAPAPAAAPAVAAAAPGGSTAIMVGGERASSPYGSVSVAGGGGGGGGGDSSLSSSRGAVTVGGGGGTAMGGNSSTAYGGGVSVGGVLSPAPIRRGRRLPMLYFRGRKTRGKLGLPCRQDRLPRTINRQRP